MVQENIQQTVDRVLDGIAEKRRAAMQTAGQTQDKGAGSPKKEFQETVADLCCEVKPRP